MEIIFQTTQSGKHVIEMGEFGRLVFSDLTKTNSGYRYLIYGKDYIERIPMKRSDGLREYRKVSQRESCAFNLQMKQDKAGVKGVPHGTIPRKLVSWFIDTFAELSDDGEHFPFKNIEKLKSKIEKTNFNKVLARKIPKKKKKIRKKPTKKEVEGQKNALAILRGSVDEKSN
jgi:hypothetical protein